MSRLIEHSIRRIVPAPSALTHSVQRLLAVGACLCVFCVGPLCGPPLRWWVLCGALPSVLVPCVGPLCGSPVRVPCVGPLCVGPLCGSPVWVPRRAASYCIYSRDASRSFTRSRLISTSFRACSDYPPSDTYAARTHKLDCNHYRPTPHPRRLPSYCLTPTC